ncbi:DUF6973 domain-containing protein [Embleya sp. NPDC059259]|uniref:DUF6973 domain-containing protein n=1 Tax=unclassified Embleya TaxID=2699296 RepID=UPI00368B595F
MPDEVARALSVSGDGWAAAQINVDYTKRAQDFAWRVGQALAQATQADNDAQWDIHQDVSARDDSFNPHSTLGRDGNGAEILTTFQTMDDPHGTTKWPGGIVGFFTDQQEITRTEVELLDRLGWLAQKDFADIKKEAFAEAEKRFTSNDKNDDHQDAFRHTYWNALLTQRFGVDWAAKYTTVHEGLPNNPGHREAMDLYNNGLGRCIAQEQRLPRRTRRPHRPGRPRRPGRRGGPQPRTRLQRSGLRAPATPPDLRLVRHHRRPRRRPRPGLQGRHPPPGTGLRHTVRGPGHPRHRGHPPRRPPRLHIPGPRHRFAYFTYDSATATVDIDPDKSRLPHGLTHRRQPIQLHLDRVSHRG